MSLFSDDRIGLPSKKLRVVWSMRFQDEPFIPVDKSIPTDSLIYAAWESGFFTSGEEKISFDGRTTSRYRIENLPFEVEGEMAVLSLVEQLRPD